MVNRTIEGAPELSQFDPKRSNGLFTKLLRLTSSGDAYQS
jgi:hypothetical protein